MEQRTATDKERHGLAGNHYIELLHFTASDTRRSAFGPRPVTAGGGHTDDHGDAQRRADVGAVTLEYSGLRPADATVVDQASHATARTSAPATVASGATPATAAGNELALGLYTDSGFGDTLTAGSGSTAATNISPARHRLVAEDQSLAAGADAKRDSRHRRQHDLADGHRRV